MKKKLGIIVICVLAVIAVGIGIFFFFREVIREADYETHVIINHLEDYATG